MLFCITIRVQLFVPDLILLTNESIICLNFVNIVIYYTNIFPVNF